MINIAVLGFGTIGSGIVELVDLDRAQVERVIPEGLYVKHILDIRKFPESPYADRITDDFEKILADPEISVICEAMGGKEPARTFTMRALEKGISVCSSNKELVEAFGPELIRTAREHGCSYLFEASVGGGIPLLHPLITCLGQEKITSITGILNGTTNYILTRMERFQESYDDVLREAQAKGYAERDPRADVEGHDTGRKIAILASLMTGKTVRFDHLSVEGITHISTADMLFARAMGHTIRLLGCAQMDDSGLCALVAPFLIPEDHMLASVQDVFNGVLIHGETVDDLLFYGRGAGKAPTASAVLSDVLAAAGHPGKHLPILWDPEELPVRDPGSVLRRFLTRVPREHEAEALRAFEGIADEQVVCDACPGDRAFTTRPIAERAYFERAASLPFEVSSIRLL